MSQINQFFKICRKVRLTTTAAIVGHLIVQIGSLISSCSILKLICNGNTGFSCYRTQELKLVNDWKLSEPIECLPSHQRLKNWLLPCLVPALSFRGVQEVAVVTMVRAIIRKTGNLKNYTRTGLEHGRLYTTEPACKERVVSALRLSYFGGSFSW